MACSLPQNPGKQWVFCGPWDGASPWPSPPVAWGLRFIREMGWEREWLRMLVYQRKGPLSLGSCPVSTITGEHQVGGGEGMEKTSGVSAMWPPLCLGLPVILNSHPIPYSALKNVFKCGRVLLTCLCGSPSSAQCWRWASFHALSLPRGAGHDLEFTSLVSCDLSAPGLKENSDFVADAAFSHCSVGSGVLLWLSTSSTSIDFLKTMKKRKENNFL